MGYTTDFSGEFTIDKPVDKETYDILVGLERTRRMKRDPKKLAKRLKMTVEDVKKKYGEECEFFFDEKDMGQNHTDDIIDFNSPPSCQPGLWCKWELYKDGQTIYWSGAEKFYDYVEWIEYIVNKILKPRGYVLEGDVTWQGEDSEDQGMICIENNVVTTKLALTYYLSDEDRIRVDKLIQGYLDNPLKEVLDDVIDRE